MWTMLTAPSDAGCPAAGAAHAWRPSWRGMPGVIVLACALAPRPALTADWEYAGATGSSNVYVDLASVQTRDSLRTAWYLFDHLDTRYDIDSARVFKSSTHRIEVDCAAGTLTWTRMEKFAGPLAHGPKISARNVDTLTAAFQETVPDSARAAMVTAVCTE